MTYGRQIRPHEGPALEHAQRHDRSRAHPPLPSNERRQEHPKHREQRIDGGVAPRLGRPALLEGHEQRRRHPDAQNGAKPVEVQILLPPLSREDGVRLCGPGFEEPCDESHRRRSDRQVDCDIDTGEYR
jgi:hypothetical protein